MSFLTLSAVAQAQITPATDTIEVQNSKKIFLACHAYISGTPYSTIEGEIKNVLTEDGYTFVSRPDSSNWVVYITAKSREYNTAKIGKTKTYTVYVDTKIAIENAATGKRIYEYQLPDKDTKGVHTVSYEEAAREAYRDLAVLLSDIIKKHVQE